MGDQMSGVLASATSVLKRAIELDSANRLGEAVICYQEGLQLLMVVLKSYIANKNMDSRQGFQAHLGTRCQDAPADKKEGYRQKVTEYMGRAEALKEKVEEQKEAGKYHEQIHIEANSTGHSYERLFSRFVDEDVTEVEVEDPYVRNHHQLYNFLRFCELLVKSKASVRKIRLVTGQDDHHDAQRQQAVKLQELGTSLRTYNIELQVEYSNTLHDREIRFNNGWIIKIGRGLDIFKATEGKFSIGFCDYDLRKCHETTVDIFHSKHLQKKFGAPEKT